MENLRKRKLEETATYQLSDLSPKLDKQFKDSLQMQFHEQRQLHDHLESERIFELEEEEKKLKELFDQHQQQKNACKSRNPKFTNHHSMNLDDDERLNFEDNFDKGEATPKAITKLMDSEGLTPFHVKSQLQKHRIAKNFPKSTKGNSEKSTSMDTLLQIENITGMQFKDALQMSLAVQRQLHEQLEIQRNLQLRIDEQAKQLKKFDQHQKQMAIKSQNTEITSSHDYHVSTNLNDDEILNVEDDYENHFPIQDKLDFHQESSNLLDEISICD